MPRWRAVPSGIGRRSPSRRSCRSASASRGCWIRFLAEEGLLANWEQEGLGADGVVTGMGTVGGRPIALMANDPAVKAGSWARRRWRRSSGSRSGRSPTRFRSCT